MEFCQVQNSPCVQVLRSPILAALHGTGALHWGSAKFRGMVQLKEWNYGTFAARNFQQRASPIFRGLPSRWA